VNFASAAPADAYHDQSMILREAVGAKYARVVKLTAFPSRNSLLALKLDKSQ